MYNMCINAEYEYCCLAWEPAATCQGADRWQQELLGAGEEGREGGGRKARGM